MPSFPAILTSDFKIEISFLHKLLHCKKQVLTFDITLHWLPGWKTTAQQTRTSNTPNAIVQPLEGLLRSTPTWPKTPRTDGSFFEDQWENISQTTGKWPKQVIWTYLGRPADQQITGASGSTASRGETRCGALAIEGWLKPKTRNGPLVEFHFIGMVEDPCFWQFFSKHVCQFHWVQILTSMIFTVSLPWVFSSSRKESNEFRRESLRSLW